MKILELFGGIGAPRKALQNLGIDFEVVDYVEINKHATKAYNALYGENFEPQDVSKWNKKIEVDLLFHGSPCQDFSIAGKGLSGEKGSGTRSSLLWETIDIIENRLLAKPKFVIWENVKAVLNKNHKPVFDKYLSKMKKLGYNNHYKILNAKDFGIPQNRERVFVVSILYHPKPVFVRDLFNFENIKGRDLGLTLSDFLNENVDDSYYIKTKQLTSAIEKGKMLEINDYFTHDKPIQFDNKGVAKIPFSTFNQENYVRDPEIARGGGADCRWSKQPPKSSCVSEKWKLRI